MKTEYLFYINSNTRYKCSKNDGKEFNAAIDILNEKISQPAPMGGFEGENYLEAYIIGMYPEFEKALKFFHEEVYKYTAAGYEMTDSLMAAKAKVTMSKFGLQKEYDFNSEPTAEQRHRLNTVIKSRQKSDIIKYAPGFFKDIGLALVENCQDYRPIHRFIDEIKIMHRIVSGDLAEDFAKQYQEIKGVAEGLAFLSLKKQGIIDDKLNITDTDAFCASKIVREFPIEGKVYNLSDGLRKLYGKPSAKNLGQHNEQYT